MKNIYEGASPEIDPSTMEYYKSSEEIYMALTEVRRKELERVLLEPFGEIDSIPKGLRQFLSDCLEHAFAEISVILSVHNRPLRDPELSDARRALLSVPGRLGLLLQGIFINIRYGDRHVQYTLDYLDNNDLEYLNDKYSLGHLVDGIRSGKRIFKKSDLDFDRSPLFLQFKNVEQKFDEIFKEIIKK